MAAHVACGQNILLASEWSWHATEVCPLVLRDGVFIYNLKFFCFLWSSLNAHFACTCHSVRVWLHVCVCLCAVLKVRFCLASPRCRSRGADDQDIQWHWSGHAPFGRGRCPLTCNGWVFYWEAVSNWTIDPERLVLLLDSGTETWSWQLGSVSRFCRGTTCCRNAMRP